MSAVINPVLAAGERKLSLQQRSYGDTGRKLSIIGFGGIVVMNAEQSHANEIVAQAVERGVNYFDVAPTYGDAQDRLGPALEPFRDGVFLACKTTQRLQKGAEEELHDSLKKLRTDHFDLYQLHGLAKMEDLDAATGTGGALETFVKAREKGLIRYIGFSAHSAEVAVEAMNRFDFDSVLFPFNYVTWHEGSFGPQVLAKAKEKNVARLALKAMAHSPWPQGASREKYGKCWYQPVLDEKEADRALRFTLSLDITAAIPPGEEALFLQALDIAERFSVLTPEEEKEVKQMAQGVKPIFHSA
ncbi:MAG: aldo/keto reductase [Candidatus Omnitrophota bacterium]